MGRPRPIRIFPNRAASGLLLSSPPTREATMENILLLVHQDTGQEARLQAALDVTRAVKGHLTCADVSVMPILADDYVGSMGTAMLLEDERTREAENRVAIEARLAGEQ